MGFFRELTEKHPKIHRKIDGDVFFCCFFGVSEFFWVVLRYFAGFLYEGTEILIRCFLLGLFFETLGLFWGS